MKTDTLIGLGFNQMIAEAQGETSTGSALINKYKSILMTNESSYSLVNQFINEASRCKYDSGVMRLLESVSDYVQSNKTSWALASACESIQSNPHSYNYLNRQACKQVEKLLEMKEDDIVNYIKAGALKNVMYCEAFRNIAKQVYKDSPIVESNAEYNKINPISLVENVGDGLCFEVKGMLFKMDNEKHIQEASWSEVSNDFKTVSRLLESKNASTEGDSIIIEAVNQKYIVSERGKILKEAKGDNPAQNFTVSEFRDYCRNVLACTNPRFRNVVAESLESIALLSEMYDNIAVMDNAAIYQTNRDEFLVIESGSELYATLLRSNHQSKWTINENAIDVLSFIKTKTNVQLPDYEKAIKEALNNADKLSQQQIEESLKETKINNLKERIALLTEKFKNDPVKLAVLSQQAQLISDYENSVE